MDGSSVVSGEAEMEGQSKWGEGFHGGESKWRVMKGLGRRQRCRRRIIEGGNAWRRIVEAIGFRRGEREGKMGIYIKGEGGRGGSQDLKKKKELNPIKIKSLFFRVFLPPSD